MIIVVGACHPDRRRGRRVAGVLADSGRAYALTHGFAVLRHVTGPPGGQRRYPARPAVPRCPTRASASALAG